MDMSNHSATASQGLPKDDASNAQAAGNGGQAGRALAPTQCKEQARQEVEEADSP